MKAEDSPYLPFPEDPAVARDLVLLKDSADQFGCSVDTLKKNAKSQRFPAYQAAHGMPVFAMPAEVEKFLRSRRDIDSRFVRKDHRKPTTPDPAHPAPCRTSRDSPVALALDSFGEPGVVRLNSLLGASHEHLALVANCLSEISEILRRDLLAGHGESQTQSTP
jgi:hypothetical protein